MTDNMNECALHMSDAARILRSINDVMRERAAGGKLYDEIVGAMDTEERLAFVELHNALKALAEQTRTFSAGSWR